MTASLNLIYTKWFELLHLFFVLYLYLISHLLTALIFGTLTRKPVFGTVAYVLFSIMPTTTVLSLNLETNKTISCSLLALSVPIKGAVSDLKCVSLGGYAWLFYIVMLLITLVVEFYIFVKIDKWRVRGRGIFSCTCRVPKQEVNYRH
jgi:hypothetical protein